MLSPADYTLAQKLAAHNAVIIIAGQVEDLQAEAFPAYAQGDRRKRPLRWVSRESFQSLQSYGGLRAAQHGFAVSESFARRLAAGESFTRQHRDMETREIYIEAGVKREASLNAGQSAFGRLCRRRDNQGKPLLTAAQQEAGHRFTADFDRAGHGHINTQNYMSAGADKTRHNHAEDAHIAQLDAGAQYLAAKAAMGEGLDKAVLAVCCHDHRLGQLERAEKWAAGSGLTVLRLGLNALVKHYGSAAGRQK